jgi:four helix bundle protein
MANDNVFSYKKLQVYAKIQKWVLMVYDLLKKFPKEEKYALCDQLRRSAISVCSNVAEGSSRSSKKEFAHYVEISYGSLMEAQSQLELSQMLGYISNDDLKVTEVQTEEIAKMLSGLRFSLVGR